MAIDSGEKIIYSTGNADLALDLVKHGSVRKVLEAERKVAYIRAFEQAEELIHHFKLIAQYSWLKSLFFASIGCFLGLFFKQSFLRFFENFLTHKLLAPGILGLVFGYTLNNTLDLGVFTFFYPQGVSTKDCRNVLIDFFSCLNLTADEEDGYYATISEIVTIIWEQRGNSYEEWEVVEFLEKQPYKKKKDDTYLITADISR